MKVDPDTLSRRDAYQLMIGAIVPRPIAWISTRSRDGALNLAPFSFFNGVTSNPMTICVSIGDREGEQKDTLTNIFDTKEFVVNFVEESSGKRMVETSRDFPPDVNEFEEAGLEPEPAETIGPPRVKGAPISMECFLENAHSVGFGPTVLVVGRVLLVHVRDDLLDEEGRIDPTRWTALGRLGQHMYTPVRETIEIPRPR